MSADLGRLALAEAVARACSAVAGTRGGPHGAPNLRTEADDELREAYARDGTDRRRIAIGGTEVGTLSLTFSRAVDGSAPEIDDAERLVAWLRESDGGLDALRRLVAAEPDRVLGAATADGELPGGCAMARRSEPTRIRGTMLRVRPEAVAAALGRALPDAVAGLLGASDDADGEVG